MTRLTTSEWLDASLAQQREAESVRCPCGYLFDWEDMEGLVTYDGDDGPQDRECPECERKLTITEYVERTYEVVTEPRED